MPAIIYTSNGLSSVRPHLRDIDGGEYEISDAAAARIIAANEAEADAEIAECGDCGSTETVDVSDERQTITICADCGSDGP